MKNIFRHSEGVNWIYPFLIILVLAASCKKEDKVGLSVQPEDGLIGFAAKDSFEIGVTHVSPDSILMSNRSIGLVGSYVDPEFGLTKANFITQLRLSSVNQDFTDITVDSAVVAIRLDNAYGKVDFDSFNLTPQTIRVYELTEAISRDSNYFHTDNFTWDNSRVIGEIVDVSPNFVDSIETVEGQEPPQLRIKMDSTWVSDLMNAGSAVFTDNSSFQDYLKGIVLVPENNHAIGEGEVLYFNPVNIYTRMTVYYHNSTDDSLSFDFSINDSTAKVSMVEHDAAGTNAGTAFQNLTDNPEKVYLQTLGGSWVRLDFKDIFDQFANEDVVVNLAEITATTVDGSDEYPTASRIILWQYQEDGTEAPLPDATSYLTGEYDYDKKEYVFKISRYIEQLLTAYKNGQDNNFGLIMIPVNDGISANRSIFYGPAHTGEDKLKLKIYYTPIN